MTAARAPVRSGTRPLALEPARCCICGTRDAEPVGVGEDFEYRTSPDSFLTVRCDHCGLVYLDPRPTRAELDHDLSRPLPRVRVHRGAASGSCTGSAAGSRRAGCSRVCDRLPADARDPRRRVRRRLPPRPAPRVRRARLAARGRRPRPACGGRGRGDAGSPCTGARSRTSTSPPSSYDFAILIQTIEHVGDPAAVLRAIRARARARAGGCSSSPTTPARSTSRSPSAATGAATTSPATGTCSTRGRCAGSPSQTGLRGRRARHDGEPGQLGVLAAQRARRLGRAARARRLVLARVAGPARRRSPRSTGCTSARAGARCSAAVAATRPE